MGNITFEELEQARARLTELLAKLNPHESLVITASGIAIVEHTMFAPAQDVVIELVDEE